MIFEINLLKDREKLRRRGGFLRIILYGELFLFFVTYIILFSFYLNLGFKIKDTQQNLSVLNEDIIFLSASGGTTLSSLKEINKKHSEMTSQLSAIKELTQSRILLSYKFKGLSQVLPENMWVDKFYITEEKTQKKDTGKIKAIHLDGFVMAEREEAFGKVQSFIKDLENEPLFKKGIDSIELSSISKPQTESFKGVTEFKIICRIIEK